MQKLIYFRQINKIETYIKVPKTLNYRKLLENEVQIYKNCF